MACIEKWKYMWVYLSVNIHCLFVCLFKPLLWNFVFKVGGHLAGEKVWKKTETPLFVLFFRENLKVWELWPLFFFPYSFNHFKKQFPFPRFSHNWRPTQFSILNIFVMIIIDLSAAEELTWDCYKRIMQKINPTNICRHIGTLY